GGADGGGGGPLRQGPAGAGLLEARPAGPALPPVPDGQFPSGPTSDLLRGLSSCPSRVGPGPRRRATNPTWKEGGNASQCRSKALGPPATKMSRSAYGA